MENPQAFPLPPQRDPKDQYEMLHPGNEGMTLRDYYATVAMQAWITCTQDKAVAQTMSEHARDRGVMVIEHIASMSYEAADAMLKERCK